MRRLMAMVTEERIDLTPLVTHRFALDDLLEAYELFSHQRDRVMKVALYPHLESKKLPLSNEVVNARG
jgi:threonine dehydrogenase-like Zn-dependent dehydrogenase